MPHIESTVDFINKFGIHMDYCNIKFDIKTSTDTIQNDIQRNLFIRGNHTEHFGETRSCLTFNIDKFIMNPEQFIQVHYDMHTDFNKNNILSLVFGDCCCKSYDNRQLQCIVHNNPNYLIERLFYDYMEKYENRYAHLISIFKILKLIFNKKCTI